MTEEEKKRGKNPEKEKELLLNYKTHRIILPVYIPSDTQEVFYKDMYEVFALCISSLINSIDPSFSNITIINNAKNLRVTEIISPYLEAGLIDKYIVNNENRGKVEQVLKEAVSATEELITIADADVLFKHNWLSSSLDIFNSFSYVGVVSPLPMPFMAFYCNSNSIKPYIENKLKSGKIIASTDLDLLKTSFYEGILNKDGVRKKGTWESAQYYIQQNNTKAILGAGHFVATYRKQVFSQNHVTLKVKHVFLNGQERKYLDELGDRSGYVRASTIKSYAYHMGNQIHKEKYERMLSDTATERGNAITYNYTPYKPVLPYTLRRKLFSFFRKNSMI